MAMPFTSARKGQFSPQTGPSPSEWVAVIARMQIKDVHSRLNCFRSGKKRRKHLARVGAMALGRSVKTLMALNSLSLAAKPIPVFQYARADNYRKVVKFHG
jgi:hypothetical protein